MSVSPFSLIDRPHLPSWCCALAAVALSTAPIEAQSPTSVTVIVVDERGTPLRNAQVTVDAGVSAVTDARGLAPFNVTSGVHTFVARALGYDSRRRQVTVTDGNGETVRFTLAPLALRLDGLVVSATREGSRRVETPATIGVATGAQIQSMGPAHPSEIMNQIPGVYVSKTTGEGHMTAIRQPQTIGAVYLFLEDGIPTRSTGFFNHNALFEINVPQAARLEVFKGPSSALYGSDAIGGMINVFTRAPSREPGLSGSMEVGENTWARMLISGSNTWGKNGVRADVNVTYTDGWRTGTDYQRQSATLRWDREFGGDWFVKTVAAFSNVDQQTAANSPISRMDFDTNPAVNYTPISYRDVLALRVSSAFERRGTRSLLAVTPYFRRATEEMLPNFALSFDPGIWSSWHSSFGVLAKYRVDFRPMRARVIGGVDVDYSPGGRFERAISATKDGAIYTAYTEGSPTYDYDVAFKGVSPYIHAEVSPLPRLRVTGGLRVDRFGYDYDDALGVLTTGRHRRPADERVTFSHVSPKLGATYVFGPAAAAFASYRHGFPGPVGERTVSARGRPRIRST